MLYKSKFKIGDKVIYKNEIGTIKDMRYLYHMDMHDYLIVFTNKEIIAPESHLQGVNENE
jgi:hypothetical protein